MRFSKFLGLALSFALIFSSCDFSNNNYSESIKRLLKTYDSSLNLKEFRACIILPIDGCSNCIAETVSYCLKNLDNNLLIIASSYSHKRIKLKFDQKTRIRANFIEDFDDQSRKLYLANSDPIIFILNDSGHAIKRIEISNETNNTNIFDKLSEILGDVKSP